MFFAFFSTLKQMKKMKLLNLKGGSILVIFLKMKQILHNQKLSICRVFTSETKKVIGIQVPSRLLSKVKAEIQLLKK